MKKAKFFGPQIYVVIEDDGTDTYPFTHCELDSIDDGTEVAIYTLQDVKKLVVNRKLESI